MASVLRRWAQRSVLGASGAAGIAVACSPGARRSLVFWSTVAPFFAEYQLVKARARFEECDEEEIQSRVSAFHKRTASRAVDVILQLGGIYVKIGQFASTMGAGILEEEYIEALKPLQDGVPPRSLAEVSAIIESDVGATMDELFLSFDPVPVGAASIAQAHRATLRDGREVIVKVQCAFVPPIEPVRAAATSCEMRACLAHICCHGSRQRRRYLRYPTLPRTSISLSPPRLIADPEVASLYAADFDNLEIVTRWLFPENMQLIHGLRKRHSAELDFRVEASNLREVGRNLRARGFEPQLVRVPTVPDERLCTTHVLAMEYLRGQSLARAIDDEMSDVARALGLGGADELRSQLMRQVQQHFAEGGGAHRFMHVAEAAAPLVRTYAAAARRFRRMRASVGQWLRWSCVRLLGPLAGVAWEAAASVPATRGSEEPAVRPDIGRAIRTLVRVHGVACLLDGVYNADPHPGNVLILPDGRLGLIDYGMVGRLSADERRSIARVTLGLAAADTEAVVGEYERAGYRACWHSGEKHGPGAVFRFATFHLDRIDLSPVRVSRRGGGSGAREEQEAATETTQGTPPPPPAGGTTAPPPTTTMTTMPVMSLLHSTIEHSVPDWVEQARRLGGLLIGVGSQAGRPISLAHEWRPIAEELLMMSGAATPTASRRLRTHLTGLLE